MIVCKLELWVGGDPDQVEKLGEIRIHNNVMETVETHGKRGTYNAHIYKKQRSGVPWKRIKIRHFPRKSYHPWNLVREILNQVAEQNGGRL